MNDSEGFGKQSECRTVSRETVFRSRRQVGLLTSAVSCRLRLPTPFGAVAGANSVQLSDGTGRFQAVTVAGP